MTKQIDLYAILGLTRYATQAQISHAYRSLLRRYHPDTRTPGNQLHDAASDADLQQLLTAYAVLRDPDRRAEYDQRYAIRPTSTQAGPIYASWTGRLDEPLRAGPVHWNPWPT